MSRNGITFGFDSETGFQIICEIDGQQHELLHGVTNIKDFDQAVEDIYKKAKKVINQAYYVADNHCNSCGAPIFEFNYAKDDMCIHCYNSDLDVGEVIQKIFDNKDDILADCEHKVEVYTNAGNEEKETTVRYTPDSIDLTVEEREELQEQWNKLVSEDVEETIKNIKKKAEVANKAIEESIKVFKEVFKDE